MDRNGHMVVDPVCRLLIRSDTAGGTVENSGRRYYFCSPVCKYLFEQHPKEYLKQDDGSYSFAVMERLYDTLNNRAERVMT